MAKKKAKKPSYACRACGAQFARWMGRCTTCGEWDTIEEQAAAPSTASKERTGGARPMRIGDVSTEDARRLPTGIGELDRALGGGPVRGGVALLGGDPGIGKSTLLMQALAALAARDESAGDDLDAQLRPFFHREVDAAPHPRMSEDSASVAPEGACAPAGAWD